MAYATQADVEARLGRSLTAAELARVEALLDDAAALIDAFTGGTVFTSGLTTGAAVSVNANMVVRVFSTGDIPAGATGQQVGPFGVQFGAGYTQGGVWLSSTDKALLRTYSGGAVSVQLESERPTSSATSEYWRSL